MGSGSYDRSAFTNYAKSSTEGRSRQEIFRQNKINPSLDPSKFDVRESRDSSDNPQSTPIILGLDVTGSMGIIAENLARVSLSDFMNNVFERGLVTNPHIMAVGLGDFYCDSAPLQATQFEADIRIAKQLQDIYLEGCGGGNDTESYDAAWYLAAFMTSIDSFEKRGQKGYLFTFGDENFPNGITRDELRQRGLSAERDYSAVELLEAAREKYHVFHIVISQGSYCRNRGVTRVMSSWREHMGNNVLQLDDYTKLPQLLSAILEVVQGASPAAVVERAPQGDRGMLTVAFGL